MDDDNVIRLLLCVILAAFFPLGMRARFRAMTTEPLDRRQEGVCILFGLRLSAVPIFLAGVVWMVDPQWMAWSAIARPSWVRWLGVVIVISSACLVLWTFRHLGKNLTDTVVTRKEHTLVTSGPYRYVRNPFYVAFGLGVLGVSLAMGNWFIPLVGVLPLGFIVARTRIEERKLVERFGVEYEDYARRVGRFVPRCPFGGA